MKASRGTLVAALLLGVTPLARGAEVEEIVVTGSRIARDPRDSSSPLTVMNASDITAAGFSSAGDAIRLLPSNTGSEFNTDVFTQHLSVGTSNFNLRGLGLNATLVLVNGRRQVVSAGVADDASSFVDLNALMPLIMLDRLEVLKDGAAAIYGSDAVAGVANYVTRDNFNGAEVRFENATTTRSAQNDFTASALVGGGNDRWHAIGGVSYLNRSALSAVDRPYALGKSFSSFGQPGAYALTASSPNFPSLPVGPTVIDPACGGVAGGSPSLRGTQPTAANAPRVGVCTFDFSSYYDLIPEERRINAYGTGHVDLTDATTAFAEVGYARERVSRGTSPSFPLLNLVTVPANNPGNIFGVPVQFLGRALGATYGRETVKHRSDTWRGVAGLRGTLDAWTWEVSGIYASNQFHVGLKDVLTDRFIAALNGRGGPNNNQYFNPFGSSATARPGDATYNDPAVIANFDVPNPYDYSSTLAAFDASATGKLGAIDVALGGQVRRETVGGVYSAAYNAENYLYNVGGPNFYGARTVWALFGEAGTHITDSLEGQVALRHEHNGEGFSSTNPKIGLLYRPLDALNLRGSFTTAFRAPSVFQTSSAETVLANIVDPLTQTTSYRGIRTMGSATLKPETARIFNLGATVAPVTDLTLSVDAWRFDYRNIIVKENAQAIILANPNDPRIVRQSGQILRIDSAFMNASSALTDGLDLSARYVLGEVTLSGDATYIRRFRITNTPTSVPYEAAGSRNYNNFARSLPKWRGQVGATWEHGPSTLGATVRMIGTYRDDQNGNARIPPQATLDAQYTFRFAPRWGLKEGPALSIGAINLTDRDPPSINTNAGYDSKVFDPRGRVIYLRVQAGW